MIDALLVLNAGSSSLKFQVFRRDDFAILAAGKVTHIGADARLEASVGEVSDSRALKPGSDHEAALAAVLDYIDDHDDGWRITAVAHRIVHGGDRSAPVVITPAIMVELQALVPLAPLHQPHNLAAIAASERLVGNVPDVACFDTAFHTGRSALFTRFAVPQALADQGVRRYGFHGLSYAWIARTLRKHRPDLHAGRVIAAHLGNGASLCAMHGGVSIDTSMGMTALDGLPMGTRCGAIDPGAVLYLMRGLGLDATAVEDILYEQSGLRGLSGISNDVEALLESDAPEAAFALDYFALKVAQFTASMAVSLGGLDALVFTGGIGEHATQVRDAVVARLKILGNFEVLVIPANEEQEMAIEVQAILETT